ncbi:endonuclease/exonuclease/phosphatase family protein [Reichenbachiella versicolor]|uniref:endonuclease/exonuclease/phosphatase family protein n=1 Tax=Reichenbachiella versicolor TaxID=1821036 RepID=UPI000D6E90C1|nr:endonuclease/exonuclease/phosphatase family protein [Reichenbachiella versicolor]
MRVYSWLILLVCIVSCNESEEETVVIEGQKPTQQKNYPKLFKSCLNALSNETLDVVTWNIEFFPKEGTATIEAVADIIENMDADIVAIQEINSSTAFADLGEQLKGWDAIFQNVNGSLDLGFLIKKDEFVSYSSSKTILNNDNDAFPRAPVLIDIEHISGVKATLVNLHLKCCNNGEDRRARASIKLKEELDKSPDTAFIVLGDFNDDINVGSPFSNFINDSNYKFTDETIATSTSANWSYPSWPSHLDHIMISDELFDYVSSTSTIILDDCISDFDRNVSDHRPVLSRFSKN